MQNPNIVLWEVDVQKDFMLKGGALYVEGAERILPNIRKLADAARRNEVLLISSGDFHAPNDPEFQQFPPHCIKGMPGADLLPEARADKAIQIENTPESKLPPELHAYQQIILEKQTLDVFQSQHADELVARLGTKPEFVVFGVVTEYCVAYAVQGLLKRNRRVAVVQDAIETLSAEEGKKCESNFQRIGARLVTTVEVLRELSPTVVPRS